MKPQHMYFMVLLIILAAGVFTFLNADGDKTMQIVTGIATAISYIIWGLIYHALEGTLHPKVVIEYVLVGIIAVVLLSTIVL